MYGAPLREEEFMPAYVIQYYKPKKMKKTIHYFIAFLSFALMSHFAVAGNDTLEVKTTAVCKTCKKTIEHNLGFEKGVKSSNLDVESGIVTVVYNGKKTNPEKIRIAITKIGYGADSLMADPKAFNKLPDCCKSEDGHH